MVQNYQTITIMACSMPRVIALKGLPIFVSSFFRNRIVIPDDCISKSFHFKLDAYGPITSVNWDFGDNTTSTELEPIHNYSQPGIYQVKAVVVLNNKTTFQIQIKQLILLY